MSSTLRFTNDGSDFDSQRVPFCESVCVCWYLIEVSEHVCVVCCFVEQRSFAYGNVDVCVCACMMKYIIDIAVTRSRYFAATL